MILWAGNVANVLLPYETHEGIACSGLSVQCAVDSFTLPTSIYH